MTNIYESKWTNKAKAIATQFNYGKTLSLNDLAVLSLANEAQKGQENMVSHRRRWAELAQHRNGNTV